LKKNTDKIYDILKKMLEMLDGFVYNIDCSSVNKSRMEIFETTLYA